MRKGFRLEKLIVHTICIGLMLLCVYGTVLITINQFKQHILAGILTLPAYPVYVFLFYIAFFSNPHTPPTGSDDDA